MASDADGRRVTVTLFRWTLFTLLLRLWFWVYLFMKLDFFIISSCLPESPETEAAMEVGATEVVESEVFYDCVICGQSGPSTEDRPIGLVVLLQASSGNSLHLPEFPHSHTLFLQCWLFKACHYGNLNIHPDGLFS